MAPDFKSGAAVGPYVSSGGGVAYNPGLKFKSKVPKATTLLTGPPAGSYDPALEAQRQAAQRGMHDTLADIQTQRHFGQKDLHQALTDIRTSAARKRQELTIDFNRGNERISNEEADTKTKAARSREDFATKRAEIKRQFADLGHRQGEAANAAGVNDAGTSAAAAAARARNQQIAEAPITTAEGRLHEDLATALGRLATSHSQLAEDRGIAGSQLKQDRDRDRRLTRREHGRNEFELDRKEQRTKREGAITNVDLLEKEIYSARQEHPGTFSAAAAAAARKRLKEGRGR